MCDRVSAQRVRSTHTALRSLGAPQRALHLLHARASSAHSLSRGFPARLRAPALWKKQSLPRGGAAISGAGGSTNIPGRDAPTGARAATARLE